MSIYHTKDTLHVLNISLLIKDLHRSLEFYVEILGLSILEKDKHRVVLTANQIDPLITLIEDRNALPPDITLGLYHFALLLPNRKELAKMVQQFILKRYPLSGAPDHGVSEALYLDDPDGNGIEIYRDRDSKEWPIEHGKVTMYTNQLNLDDLLLELDKNDIFEKVHCDTLIGHLHFHVDELDSTKSFYEDTLGFTVMLSFLDSAIFLGANGYHHHIGLNTWNGHAPLNKIKQVGLKSYVLNVPHQLYPTLIRNLTHSSVPVLVEGERKYVIDPLGQKVIFEVQPS